MTDNQPAQTDVVADRNFVRMQAIAQGMAKALREIADGCNGRIDKDSVPALIAEKALNSKNQTLASPAPDAIKQARREAFDEAVQSVESITHEVSNGEILKTLRALGVSDE